MAVLHDATLTPPKLEILQDWVPGRPWAAGAGTLEKVGTFRFDDPAGEVGIETFLLRDGDRLLQVPLTYRGHPLPGADAHLIATMEHSVLGTRWVYDGCGDPVWAAAAVTCTLTGGDQARQFRQAEEGLVPVASTVTVSGSGAPGADVTTLGPVQQHDDDRVTVVDVGPYELVVARVVGTELDAAAHLSGEWDGGSGVLVGVRTLG
jgi:hypothetical protein